MLGVALVSEGVTLRKAGIDAPILVFVPESPSSWDLYCSHKLTMSIISDEMLGDVRSLLEKNTAGCRAHINVDTGMGRIGIPPDTAVELVEKASRIPGLTVEGIYTHFPSADEDRDDYSQSQIDRFTALLDALSERGIRPPLAHMCNSAGTLKFPGAHLDLVRPGIMTYGLTPFPGSRDILELEPVLSLTSRIRYIKDVPAGTPISYGGTFVTKRPSRLATVPIGYGDGYNRHLSNRGRAIVNGAFAPVAGRVCMDQTVFDITDAGAVRVGDSITLIGRDGDKRITVEELAILVGTISHEIVTGITGRVSRAFIKSS